MDIPNTVVIAGVFGRGAEALWRQHATGLATMVLKDGTKLTDVYYLGTSEAFGAQPSHKVAVLTDSNKCEWVVYAVFMDAVESFNLTMFMRD